MLLTARDITKAHSLQTLFTRVSLSVTEGERLGLIGPNGAGKSTLLKILAGEEEADSGDLVRAKNLRAVYVPQQDEFPPEATVRSVVVDAAMRHGVPAGVRRDEHEAQIIADMMLGRVGFDEEKFEVHAQSLSGGWRKRLSIARALGACAGEPDLLLLDEPTNHLDLDGIRWLEEFVKRSAGSSSACVFVTHDRTLLESVATRVIELSTMYPQGLLAVDGNYSEFLRRKEEFLSSQARAEQVMANQVRKDLAWLARGPQARRTKSKSRIGASHARIEELSDLRVRNTAAMTPGAKVDFHSSGRRTRKFVQAESISKSLGGHLLFSDLDIAVGAGDCLGLLGPNGSGKTTLIRVLTGILAPDTGTVERSEPPPRIAVFSQLRQEFPPQTLLRTALSPGGDTIRFRGQPMHITAWSRRFLFRDDQLEQPVSSLSGGELARIHIARIMLEPADVLVLDEPTNDLDIPTLETLEESLEDFPGGLILVTHDRAMLDRLASEVIALDGKGGARRHATLGQALAAEAARSAKPDAERRTPAAKSSEPPAATPRPRKKLTFSEQHEYDAIEARIAEAEAAAAAAEAQLSEPAITSDHEKMARACQMLSDAQLLVASLYARWEELEAKRT